MPKVTISSIDHFLQQLNQLGADVEKIAEKAVYAGAGIMADEYRAAIEALPIDNRFGTEENPRRGVTEAEKKGLLDGLGITPITNDNGYINAKIGFDGYNDNKTEKWPKGKPNQMVARAINSGTSFSEKMPFADTATQRGRARARKRMVEIAEEEIDKILKG